MSKTQRSHPARRRYQAFGAGVAALALGGIVMPAASAATTPPPYTIADVADSGVVTISNVTHAVSTPLLPTITNKDVAFSPDGRTEYVLSSSALTPITLATGAVGAPIALGVSTARALAISPDGATAFVADTSGSVIPVALRTGVAGAPIALTTPVNVAVAIAPDGKRAYVGGSDAGVTTSFLTPVDVATGAALTPIALNALAFGGPIVISPDGKTAYLTGADKVLTVDLAGATLGAPIAVPLETPVLAISPDGKTLYAGGFRGGVVAIDLATGAVGPVIATPAGVGVASLAVTPDGKTLYLSHRHNNNFTNPLAEVFAIDLATGVLGPPMVTNTDDSIAGTYQLAITPDQAPVATVKARVNCATVALDASGSTVRFGTIMRYVWSFGDGKTAVTTTPRTTHTYAHAGAHTVTVTETDSAGTSTQRVSNGKQLLLNGGPSARTTVAVTSQTCSTSVLPADLAKGSSSTGAVAGATLPRTGLPTRDELTLAALLMMLGAGMVTLSRRHRS